MTRIRLIAGVISMILAATSAVMVARSADPNQTAIVWFAGICLAALAAVRATGRIRPSVDPWTVRWVVGFSILHILVLRFFGTFPTHYHQDEFITAFTSFSLPLPDVNWFGTYPPVWVARFPIVFHLLQWPFFRLFGPSVDTIRMSVYPYVVACVVYLFVFAKTVFGRRAAVIAGFMYAFFAPHLYLTSMGLHFVSSTAFYMAAITHATLLKTTGLRRHAVLFGLAAALCLLTYTSSYAIVPSATLLLVALFLRRRTGSAVGLGIGLCVALVVFSPFLSFAATKSNFLTERVAQVNLFNGTWKTKERQEPINTVLTDQLTQSVKAIFPPGMGGAGGYNFGGGSLLSPVAAVLFAAGLLTLCIWTIRAKSYGMIALLVGAGMPVVFGLVLTIHPPPLHRISVAFPLLALISALPVDVLTRKMPRMVRPFIVSVAIVIAAVAGLSHTSTMIGADSAIYNQNSRLVADIIRTERPEGTPVTIAAYDSFYLGQELTFRLGPTYPIRTTTFENIIGTYDGGYMVVWNLDEAKTAMILAQYPDQRIVTSVDDLGLGDLSLIAPP